MAKKKTTTTTAREEPAGGQIYENDFGDAFTLVGGKLFDESGERVSSQQARASGGALMTPEKRSKSQGV